MKNQLAKEATKESWNTRLSPNVHELSCFYSKNPQTEKYVVYSFALCSINSESFSQLFKRLQIPI